MFRRDQIKAAAHATAMFPLVKIAVMWVRGTATNPVEATLNRLGFWALVWLVASLACTPAKTALRWTWPNQLRRLLGLWCFAYALMHWIWYLAVDQGLDVQAILDDVVKRKFITIGFAALALLTPLAVTSTDRMVKSLGYIRWKRLHQLAYAAAVLAVIHFYWRVKADTFEPAFFGTVLSVLFFVRVAVSLKTRRNRVAA